MKKMILISSFAMTAMLVSCGGLIKVDTGKDPLHIQGVTGDFSLVNTGRPQLMASNSRATTPVVHTNEPLPAVPAFNDGVDLNTLIKPLSLAQFTWNVCYGFKNATLTNLPQNANLPATITISSISVSVTLSDAVATASVTLGTTPANAAITLTKNSAGTGYNITAANSQLCAVIPGATLEDLNKVQSNGTQNNVVVGKLNYTISQETAIGGSPILKVEFDEGSSSLTAL